MYKLVIDYVYSQLYSFTVLFLLRFSCYLGVGSGEAGDGGVAGGLVAGDDDGG